MQFTTKLPLIITLALTASVCGAEPSAQSSRYYGVGGTAISSFEFVYHKSELKFVSSEGTGTGTAFDTDFNDFGAHLMDNAKKVFSTYGVNVVGVRSSKTKMPFTNTAIQAGDGTTSNNKILFIYANSAHVNSNSQTTHVNYKFDVRLLDPIRRKANWMASIDTSTWVGNDAAIKNKSPVLYDAKYAEQFLKRVADKMKADGVI